MGLVGSKHGSKRGPPVVRIDGGLYHLYSDKTFPYSEETAAFSHLYVIDERAALESRIKKNNRSSVALTNIISKVMESNIYANNYRCLRAIELEMNNQ